MSLQDCVMLLQMYRQLLCTIDMGRSTLYKYDFLSLVEYKLLRNIVKLVHLWMMHLWMVNLWLHLWIHLWMHLCTYEWCNYEWCTYAGAPTNILEHERSNDQINYNDEMCIKIRTWLKDNKLMAVEADKSRATCIIEE